MLALIGGYLFVFVARLTDVSLATIRIVMVVRGQKLYAAAIGFFEMLIYITTLNLIVHNLNNPLNLVIYAAGYATGNYLGPTIEEKLAVGTVTVQVITMKYPHELTELLREKGYGVTIIEGQGREGIRYILQIILKRKCMQNLRTEIDKWDKNAFWTIFDARSTKGGFMLRKGK